MPRLPSVEPLAAQCRHFVDCIFTGNEPSTNFQEAADVVEILEAANASREQGGERVKLEHEAARV
jgi:predicted dehydrogenase